MSAILGTQP